MTQLFGMIHVQLHIIEGNLDIIIVQIRESRESMPILKILMKKILVLTLRLNDFQKYFHHQFLA